MVWTVYTCRIHGEHRHDQHETKLIRNFPMVFSLDTPYATDDGHKNDSNASSEPCVSEMDISSSEEEVQLDDHDEEWRLVAIGIEEADQVCVKLNDLLR